MVELGKKAPDFTLEGIDAAGVERKYSLKDFLATGKPLVLYFYPKDDTPGCTQEACDFRDSMARLTQLANVAGVSRDSIARHQAFQQKYMLPFALLSDPDQAVHELYGAWGEKVSDGKPTVGAIRSTFIITPEGKVTRLWMKVSVKGHVDEVMAELKAL